MRNRAAALTLALALFCQPLLAESLTVAEEDRPAPGMTESKPAATATAKPAATPAPKPAAKPTAEPVKAAVVTPPAEDLGAKIGAISNAVEQVRSKGDSLDAEVKSLREDLKEIEERSLEIKEIVRDVELFKTRVTELEKQYASSKKDTEKYLGDFEQLKNSLKDGMDRQESVNDILEVLKKEINNNELELAKIKKSINEVKGKYGDEDNFVTAVLKWPYLGITALGLSIIAVGVAVAK